MKIALIVFGVVVTLLAVMIFGSFGLSRLVRWIGWQQDVLAALAVLFILLAGVALSAWRIGDMEDTQKRRAELKEKP